MMKSRIVSGSIKACFSAWPLSSRQQTPLRLGLWRSHLGPGASASTSIVTSGEVLLPPLHRASLPPQQSEPCGEDVVFQSSGWRSFSWPARAGRPTAPYAVVELAELSGREGVLLFLHAQDPVFESQAMADGAGAGAEEQAEEQAEMVVGGMAGVFRCAGVLSTPECSGTLQARGISYVSHWFWVGVCAFLLFSRQLGQDMGG